MRSSVVLSWSGGKDSALVLQQIKRNPDLHLAGLVTSFVGEDPVIPLHNVPFELVRKQAERLQLPLIPVFLPENPGNEEYVRCWRSVLQKVHAEYIAFGDIFLEDIRQFRVKMLDGLPIRPVFPLWGKSSQQLLAEFWKYGWEAVIVCIDATMLPRDVLGKKLDRITVDAFAEGVDPCGENGEYHTFVCNGPFFSSPMKVHCTGFCEVVPPFLSCVLRELEE